MASGAMEMVPTNIMIFTASPAATICLPINPSQAAPWSRFCRLRPSSFLEAAGLAQMPLALSDTQGIAKTRHGSCPNLCARACSQCMERVSLALFSQSRSAANSKTYAETKSLPLR